MPFTDDDLKRLKEGKMSFATLEKLLGCFIARLEAAEDRHRDCNHQPDCNNKPCSCGYIKRLNIHRKSAGKS